MKRINVVYILAAVLVLEVLLSTKAYNEPSFMTNNVERFDNSKITQIRAQNVVNEKWTFDSSTNYLNISMRKTSESERSLYDVGFPIDAPLVGHPTIHARLFASDLNVNEDVIRAYIVLINETHIIELNYFIGRKPEDETLSSNALTPLYLHTSVSNVSNGWVTIDRDIVEDLTAKNISVETNEKWRISKFCIGGMLFQKNETVALSMLVDVYQTYLELGGIKVYQDKSSANMPMILLIAGLFLFSSALLALESEILHRRHKNEAKLHENDVFEKAVLIFILQVALLIRLAFLDSGQLASDEAIYTYTSYLISKGVLPYKEVFMAHPPLSFYITAVLMWIFEPSYPSFRLLSICIFLGTIILTYLLSKTILGKLDGKYSLLVAVFYALYPSWFTFNSIASSLENLLTLFALLSVFFYVLYLRNKKNRYLVISGLSGGCTLLVTLRASFFLISLIIFHLAYITWIKKLSEFFRYGSLFAFGLAVSVGSTLGLLVLGNAFQYFYLDVVTYQLSIFRMSMNDRLWYLGQYLAGQWPLLLLAGLSISLTARTVKQTRNIWAAIPGFLFFLNFLFFSSFGFLMHYLQFLSPFLSIISVLGIIEMKKMVLGGTRTRVQTKAFVCIFLVVLGFFSYLTATSFYQISLYFHKNPYDRVNYYIGKRIANITSPSDYIWSGEAAIGFFSKRMIVAPSSDFRFIGCSDSIIGFDYGKDRGAEIRGYNDGFVTVEDFIQSWESKHVKVLVFIMNKGWIPYVDQLLWNGYREHLGAAEYVSQKYELQEVVFSEDVPYIYYIWVRR